MQRKLQAVFNAHAAVHTNNQAGDENQLRSRQLAVQELLPLEFCTYQTKSFALQWDRMSDQDPFAATDAAKF